MSSDSFTGDSSEIASSKIDAPKIDLSENETPKIESPKNAKRKNHSPTVPGAADLSDSQVQSARLQWDDLGQPFSTDFADIYFSQACGLAETEHVFLQHNQLATRFAALKPHEHFVIGETGFGSGLNFLAAWRLFQRLAPTDAQLHFVSAEKYPLTKADLARALALWPDLQSLAQPLIERYPSITQTGFYRVSLDNARVHLTLLIDDAAAAFAQLMTSDHPLYRGLGCKIDAWFLDGFAPSKNPAMWSDALFDCLAHLSRAGTTAATFSAAGIVKRGLKRAGFTLKKVPGHGKKREMLTGLFNPASQTPVSTTPSSQVLLSHQNANCDTSPSLSAAETPPTTAELLAREINALTRLKSAMPYECPWHLDADTAGAADAPIREVVIIGGGISGCHSARALAERGWQVRLLEQSATLASAGSGNPQGVVYAKLSPKDETQAQFNEVALQYALQFYAPYFAGDNTDFGQACGVLQLAHTAKEAQLHQELRSKYERDDALIQFVDAEQASALAGTTLAAGGIFFKDASWIDPRALCQTLVNHPNIRVYTNTRVQDLKLNEASSTDDLVQDFSTNENPVASAATTQSITNDLPTKFSWHIRCEGALDFIQSPYVVLCTAEATNQLLDGDSAFPLKSIRGQITQFDAVAVASHAPTPLKTVICANGYIAPPLAGAYTTGATFDLKSQDLTLRLADHQTNLNNCSAALPAFAPALAQLTPLQLSGRAALRISLPDYLPLVGPVADASAIRERFAKLAKNAQAPLYQTGRNVPGLFVNVGVGSRGLAYSPLAAQLLAAYMNREPMPVTRNLARSLHPARFIIRDLIKNKSRP